MPRFILIQESTRHACFVTRDEIVRLIDVRSNPAGYTDVDRCIAMLENPADGVYRGLPVPDTKTRMGPVTFHVEGRMDFKNHGLIWKEIGHRCDVHCVLPGLPRSRRF